MKMANSTGRGWIVFVSVLIAAFGSACESATSPAPVPAAASPGAAPPSNPPSNPPPQSTTTPVPFNLTESRTFAVLGWDSWPGASTPSQIQVRWNAAIGTYEVLAPGYADWSRLEARPDVRWGGTPYEYDVLRGDGTTLPFRMQLRAPPHRAPRDGSVGNALILEASSARDQFAFGIPTEPADVPVSGTMTCEFAEDEIGGGTLTFDLGAGTVSGWGEPFWGGGVRYDLIQTSFSRGATTFSTRFGTAGVLDGRFFGRGATNVAVRAMGGGERFAALSGIMTGECRR